MPDFETTPAAKTNPLKYTAQTAAIAVLYILSARAGLQLEATSGFATLVWPPTGIAIAALLLGGYRLWPGVFVGALVANVLTGATLPVAIGIATGNTLEGLMGAYALLRFADFRPTIDRVRDAVAFILLSATIATLASATIGVASLHLGGIVARGQLGDVWRAWWLGDAIGAVLVAPLVLVWLAKPPTLPPTRRLIEASALVISLGLASLFIFGVSATRNGPFNEAYLFFPFMIWAAIRFAQHGAVAMTFLVSVIAVWGTATGHGPFVQATLHDSLFALQTFLGVTGATFLVLGSATAERERAAAELKAAHAIAAKANQAKAEFLAVMSHELRTPLNAIAGYSELLALGVTGPLNEKQADALSRIRRNQQHLLGLIDDVLSFARIEAGSSKVVARRVLLGETFDALDAVLRPDLLRKGLELEHASYNSDLEVYADPEKLRQIMLNIVGNAIKFTPRGGRIRLAAARESGVVRITVTDTGIGVPADKLGHIFEPFFQVDSGKTREYPGVGLGLAIALDLAHTMGGEIHFDSAVGKGSTVSLVLPVLSAA